MSSPGYDVTAADVTPAIAAPAAPNSHIQPAPVVRAITRLNGREHCLLPIRASGTKPLIVFCEHGAAIGALLTARSARLGAIGRRTAGISLYQTGPALRCLNRCQTPPNRVSTDASASSTARGGGLLSRHPERRRSARNTHRAGRDAKNTPRTRAGHADERWARSARKSRSEPLPRPCPC